MTLALHKGHFKLFVHFSVLLKVQGSSYIFKHYIYHMFTCSPARSKGPYENLPVMVCWSLANTIESIALWPGLNPYI